LPFPRQPGVSPDQYKPVQTNPIEPISFSSRSIFLCLSSKIRDHLPESPTVTLYLTLLSNFSFQFVPSSTFEEEMHLFERMLDNGVFIFPSSYFLSPEPGWFRIIFAMDTETLQLGKLAVLNRVS